MMKKYINIPSAIGIMFLPISSRKIANGFSQGLSFLTIFLISPSHPDAKLIKSKNAQKESEIANIAVFAVKI